MVWFIPIKQLQMEVATSLICESLKEFAGQTEAERTRCILLLFRLGNLLESQLFQASPDQERSAAKIHYGARQAFVHRHVRFPFERLLGIEGKAVPANPFFVAQG